MSTTSDDVIWNAYLIVSDFNESVLRPSSYARLNNIDYGFLTNICYRVNYKKFSDLVSYKKMCSLAREYLTSKLLLSEFCNLNSCSKNQLSPAITHINYLDAIERMKLEKGHKEEMNFIKVPQKKLAVQQEIEVAHEAEIMEEQNDIEIVIKKGVKVSISSNIDSTKIIKIIELLKDL